MRAHLEFVRCGVGDHSSNKDKTIDSLCAALERIACLRDTRWACSIANSALNQADRILGGG